MTKRVESLDEATWAITSASGQFAGVARVIGIDHVSRRAELGLYLSRSLRSKGFGADAVELMKKWAIEFLGMHRLEARVLAQNGAAIALFERAGFEREGCLRDHEYRLGEYHDLVLLGLVAPL